MNTTRAAQYVTQALERLKGLEELRQQEGDTPLTSGEAPGLWASLKANLTSAAADLTPAEHGP